MDMTDDARMADVDARLTRSLRAAAPHPAPDFADRVLRQTAATPQRRGWTLGFSPVLAVAAVVVLAIVVGLGIANLLPIEPNVGDDAKPPPASAEPSDATPSATTEATVSPDAPTPSPSPSADPTADWPRCENDELGFAVSYPPDWWVQEPARPDPALDPLPGCTYFAPEPVDIPQNAGLPNTIAIMFNLAEVPLGNPEQPIRVISSRDLEVARLPATVEEIEWTDDTGFQRVGQRSYGYSISLPNGEVLLASVDSAAGDYEEEKRVLDQMIETLELLEP